MSALVELLLSWLPEDLLIKLSGKEKAELETKVLGISGTSVGFKEERFDAVIREGM